MSRREDYTAILTEKLSVLAEHTSHELLTNIVESAVSEILETQKTKREIIHVVGPNGHHRLIVDGQTTDFVAPNELAKNGDFVASTDFFNGQLPQVARIVEIDQANYKTTSQQNMRLDPVRYSEAAQL